jgi:hypothetical protein
VGVAITIVLPCSLSDSRVCFHHLNLTSLSISCRKRQSQRRCCRR